MASSSTRLARLAVAALLVSAMAAGLRAAPPPMKALPRQVLVMLDSREGDTFEDNDVQHFLAFPMYQTGLRPVYLDLAKEALPGPLAMAPYAGVVAYQHHTDCNDPLRKWLHNQHAGGRRVLMLASLRSEPGEAPSDCEEQDEQINQFLKPYGLHYSGLLTAEGAEDKVRPKRAQAEWFDFEKKLSSVKQPPYQFMRSTSPENEVHLQMWMEGIPDSETDMIVTGPWGGYAVTEYLWGPKPGRDLTYWIVDPLRFVEAAFGWKGLPRVEANVLNGKRVFFSHVDGDGFNSFAYDRPSKICGQIVYDEILQDPKYAELPHTISVISAEIDPPSGHVEEASIPTARRIFDLDHVEAASHAFSHPMDWRGDTLAFEDIVLDGTPYEYDSHKETVGSLETIAALAPDARPPRVMLWSGSCNPDAATLRRLREKGYLNMNGGDPRLDEVADSWTQLAPPVWQVEDEIRFSSGAANDYLMTNEWTPPFTGFRDILETFRRSEDPRPLTPVDVYYHFYIAERQSSFRTLKQVLNWCLKQDYAKLFTSEYLDAMGDLVTTTLERGPNDWWGAVTGGKLPSLRFDAETRHVDMQTATGVLGYTHRWGSLYVYLDHHPHHRFQLVDSPKAGIRLVEANRPLRLQDPGDGELLAFEASGPGTSSFRFGGFEPGQYLSLHREGGPTKVHALRSLRADDEGVVLLDVRLGLGARVTLKDSSAAELRAYEWNVWFAREGRYGLLVGVLALLGWLLCRFYRPQLAPAEPRKSRSSGIGGAAGFTVEEAVSEPAEIEGLPAGGVGPWAGELSDTFPVEGDE